MRFTMLAALLLLLFFSCNNRAPRSNKDIAAPVAASAPARASAATADTTASLLTDEVAQYKADGPPGESRKQPHIATPPQPAANPDWDRKIIKTADLSIETKSFPAFTSRLHRLVHDNGGYITQEEQTQSNAEIANTVSIKVPVDRFEDLLQRLPADSDRLIEKKISSQDVGMELVDTKSRLETKRQVRERYRDLLLQAHKMEDILSIQQQIDGIQEEMEGAAGRINYLGHAAALSTVNLKFFQVLDAGAVESPATPTLLHRISLSFLQGWDFLSSLLLGLLSVWPLWLAAGFGLAAWRRHQARTVKKPA
jgi:hypothetical protein